MLRFNCEALLERRKGIHMGCLSSTSGWRTSTYCVMFIGKVVVCNKPQHPDTLGYTAIHKQIVNPPQKSGLRYI